MKRLILLSIGLFLLGAVAGVQTTRAEKATGCGGPQPMWCMSGPTDPCGGWCQNFPCGSDLCVDEYGAHIGISCAVCVT